MIDPQDQVSHSEKINDIINNYWLRGVSSEELWRSRKFWKLSSGTTQLVEFHLPSKWIFRELFFCNLKNEHSQLTLRRTTSGPAPFVRLREMPAVESVKEYETKLWLTASAKQHRNPCSMSTTVYPDLSTRHDLPVKNTIVD